MSLVDTFHAVVAALQKMGHPLADEAHRLWDRLRGDEAALTTEVSTDAHHLAVTAGPLVAEVKADAKSIGEDIAQEAKAMGAEAADIAKP